MRDLSCGASRAMKSDERRIDAVMSKQLKDWFNAQDMSCLYEGIQYAPLLPLFHYIIRRG